MKHVYLHTSDHNSREIFKNEEKFAPPFEYPPLDYSKSLRNEYGRIESRGNYYHILLGKIPQERCPWCGIEPILRIITNQNNIPDPQIPIKMFYCCPQCGSQGPVLHVNTAVQEDKKMMEHFKDFVRQRYADRRMWDADLINPYEEK